MGYGKYTIDLYDICTNCTDVFTCNSSEPGHDTVIGTTIYMSPEVMRGASEDEEQDFKRFRA